MKEERLNQKGNKNFFGFRGTGGANLFTYPVHSHDHVIYIDDLEWSEDHQDRLQVIRMASPDDHIRVIINSPGGLVSLAMAYVSAISESAATVVTHAEGNVCSAGTILWLASKERTVAPLTGFMFHNYQGGTFGDGANMYAQIAFEKQYFDRLMDTFYNGVLTETELATIKGGGQVWMDEVEICKRTNAILLDEANIRRAQEGRPLKAGVSEKSSKTSPVQKDSSLKGDEKAVLTINLDDETFSFDLETLSEKDFDVFNVKELNMILQTMVGNLGIDGIEDSADRGELIAEIITCGQMIKDGVSLQQED